jgi:hypothetical protein
MQVIDCDVGKAGDDFPVTATDFPHGDAFRQDRLAQGLMRSGDISEKTLEKNPSR